MSATGDRLAGVMAMGAAALLLGGRLESAQYCATRDQLAATLLVPYFRVGLGGSQGDADIPEGVADTWVSVTNPGKTGVVAQVTVWSKYGKPVFAFNVPLVSHDVAAFRMRDVLNGRLNVNPNTQRLAGRLDPCGLNTSSGAYAPATGFGPTRYIRFRNPDPEDAARAVAVYPSTPYYPVPALPGAERLWVWDSLDESGDVRSLLRAGPNVVDVDNPACGDTSDAVLEGDLTGSLTIDVLNYCTTRLPDDPRRYSNDGLATSGWEASGYSPNTLLGDVFYDDGSSGDAHASGDGVAALEFDPGLKWTEAPTFYARYGHVETATPAVVPEPFRFAGDGRRPLGTSYAFRFLSDRAAGLRSWAIVWRSDRTSDGHADLCGLRRDCMTGGGCFGNFVHLRVFDNESNTAACSAPAGACGPPPRALFLQTQRIDLLENRDFDPMGYTGGYVELGLLGNALTDQAFVAVQHSAPALALSVGHAAAELRPAAPCAISRTPFRPLGQSP